jgi:N-acetyl sugar amidotransferase
MGEGGGADAGEYRICTRCVMDTSDRDIRFDEAGVCNHCHHFDRVSAERLPRTPDEAAARLASLVGELKRAGEGREYDCVMGLSGGADSSFVAVHAARLGLRPLAIHLDNGWNSELAVQNIENIVRKLNLDLVTHVIDWDEFRDIQRAFLRASVVDIELITDHAITALVDRAALEHKVKYVLSGSNVGTEAVMPASWTHRKSDLRNLRAIHRRFGSVPMKTLPTASSLRIQWWQHVRGLRFTNLLDLVDYRRDDAVAELEAELGWRDYGGKHFESFFTRFYQTVILPEKFGIDKRRPHLANMVMSRQRTREDALAALAQPIVDPAQREADIEFVLKKLRIDRSEFDEIMASPPRSHLDFPSDEIWVKPLLGLKARLVRR